MVYKIWLGHYTHKHGTDVAVYPTQLACKLGLFSAVLPYVGGETSPLHPEHAATFVKLYAAGDYDKAIIFFNSHSRDETLAITESDFDPDQKMRPYNEAELKEVTDRISANKCGEQ